MDTVVFTNDRVHLLVRSPAELSRRSIVRLLQSLTTTVLKRAQVLSRWDRRIWDQWAWCSILTSPAAVSAVRRWLVARYAVQLGGWDWRWETGSWESAHRGLAPQQWWPAGGERKDLREGS